MQGHKQEQAWHTERHTIDFQKNLHKAGLMTGVMGSTFLAGCAPSLAPTPSPTSTSSPEDIKTDEVGNEKLTTTLFYMTQ